MGQGEFVKTHKFISTEGMCAYNLLVRNAIQRMIKNAV